MLDIAASLTFPSSAWAPAGDRENPHSRLLTTIEINGIPFHLEAWEVEYRPYFCQAEGCRHDHAEQVATEDDENFGKLFQAFGADGSFRVAQIHGRSYVLFASPYCD